VALGDLAWTAKSSLVRLNPMPTMMMARAIGRPISTKGL
jgi:hypothetical protein